MSDKSKMVALILCLAFGLTGIGGLHRMYAGKFGSGILQFLTGGGFLIWQLIDLFQIIGGSFTDANDKQLA